MQKLKSLLFHRLVLVGAALIFQLVILVVMMVGFGEYFVLFYWVAIVLSVIAVLWIVSNRSNPGYKIAWLIPILTFPAFGGLVYLIFGGNKLSKRARRKLLGMEQAMIETLAPDFRADDLIATVGEDGANMARYLERYAHCPVYQNTHTSYYALGDDCFPPMLEALRHAKRYIFIEYFIINQGIFWGGMLDILKEKAAQGLDVRVIYDDIGSMYTLPADYPQQLEAFGIQCIDFNRFVPVLASSMNNRDHRKICVVDGQVAFTGGVNLADEYINAYEKFGHWKDSAIRLEGDGAWSMAVMFLTLWDFAKGIGREDLSTFRPPDSWQRPTGDGWVQPYTDCPWDGEAVGATVYLNLISKAKRYLYITTPYLIIDESLIGALLAAAKSGVDVRIMTPHVADKKVIFEVTRAHYEPLLEGGVKIYEYTPGFVHGKNFAVDDRFGTVGSVNLDYRSLYLHFENGVILYDNPAVCDIRDDFLETLAQCQPITLEACRSVPIPLRILRSMLRVFAPLM